jgi:hypothetical protein
MNNNIINFILQTMTSGINPQQLIQQNPQMQVLMNQMQQSGMSMRDFTLQYAKQNNINLEPIFEVQKTGATGALSWHVAGLESSIDNLCKISCNGASREVKIYCDHSAIFDQITDDAMVLLGADGRTNATSLE